MTLRAGFASRIASTMLAWFSSSEMRTVFSSVKRRDQGLVCVPAGRIGQRGLGADELGERCLELEVGLERAADEADGRGPGAVAIETLLRRLDHLRVRGQPQVVVRGEHEHLAVTLHLDDRPLRGAQREEGLVGIGVPQLVELGREVGVAGARSSVGPPREVAHSLGRRALLRRMRRAAAAASAAPPGKKMTLHACPASSSSRARSKSVERVPVRDQRS